MTHTIRQRLQDIRDAPDALKAYEHLRRINQQLAQLTLAVPKARREKTTSTATLGAK